MKHLLFIVAFFLLVPSAEAAIARDSSQWQGMAAGATGMTGTAHTNTGADGLLIACIFSSNALTNAAMTYNSVSMTSLGSVSITGGGSIYVFGLLSPTTGSAISPIATWDSSAGVKAIYSASYTGVYQTALPSNTSTNTSGGANSHPASMSLAIDANANSWELSCLRNENNDFDTITAGGYVVQSNIADANAISDSNGTVTASATYSFDASWTGDAATKWGGINIQIRPSVAAASSPTSILGLIRAFWLN